MSEFICLKCGKVFLSAKPECCGEVARYDPCKYGSMIVGTSNAWINIDKYQKKHWKNHKVYKKISRKLYKDGCYSSSAHLIEFVDKLIEKLEKK